MILFIWLLIYARSSYASMVNNGTLTTYTYDANNRMLTETEGGTTKAYTYDANGNQLTGDGATYTYNARGQQTGYSKGSVTASYTYLPTGLRKSKTVGITTTNFVWDGQNMVYEYNGTNSTGGTAYYYGLTLISQGNYAYYLYNAHGDVVQLVSSIGSLGLSYIYDAFGNEVNPSAIDTNPFRYAGQYFDSETGTYYLRARYYNPSVGRFTQCDTHWNIDNKIYGDVQVLWGYAYKPNYLAMIQSQNLYAYCVNSPNKYYDPTGWAVSKDKPPTEEDGYIAPKGGPKTGKDSRGNKGWVDKNGNIWIPVPDGSPQAHGGGQWDVQRPDGNGYVNRYPGGKERPGSGKRPKIPKPSKIVGETNDNTIIDVAIGGAATIGLGYVAYRVIRMIPSLFPGFWWTLPVNVAVP